MAHLSPLDQAAVRLCIAAGSLIIVLACMQWVEWESADSHFWRARVLLVPAVGFFGLALHQLWQALKFVCRWLDDMVIDYQVNQYPLVRA